MKNTVYVSGGKTYDLTENKYLFGIRLCDHPGQDMGDSAYNKGDYYSLSDFDNFIKKAKPHSLRVFFDTQEELDYLISRIAPFVVNLDLVAKSNRTFDFRPVEACLMLETVEMYWNTKQETLWDVRKNTKLKHFRLTDYYKVSDFSAFRGSTVEILELYGCNGFSSFVSKMHIKDLSFIVDMPHLTRLALDIVKDEGSEYYLNLLSKCKNLTSFWISQSFFTFNQYAWLRSKLPNVREGLEGVVYCDEDKYDSSFYYVLGKRMPKSLRDEARAQNYKQIYHALVEKYVSIADPPSDNEKIN